MKNKLSYILRLSISILFLVSVIAKLYPTPMYGITKIFEEGQLIPMGFSESLAPYVSRFIIAIELFISIAILQKNYLKKIVIPASIFLLLVFSTHLAYQVFLGDSDNCGCFGELIPMTPLQAIFKNIITIFFLLFIYKNTISNRTNNVARLYILFLTILLIVFILVPFSKGKSSENSFLSHVSSEEFRQLPNKKVLCFFDAGCEHCQEAAAALDSLSYIVDDFPSVYIIFSDTEEDKIPNFFDFVGREYPYQVMPFANYETDEIDSYMEITFPDYDNPIVIFYDDMKQIRLFEGTSHNEFNAEELRRILE